MCGFAGVVGVAGDADGAAWASWASRQLERRGPDASGEWSDPDAGVHMGFRRLSIIDLSGAGSQPMIGPSGRSVLLFNGELYEHVQLRRRLERDGVCFRGRSDTEVVAAALERWGPKALDRFDGMFGLAWYLPAERRLLLARDHAGIKPLFIGHGPSGRGVSFASQYDVVANGPWGRADLDPEALALYLELHHIPAPYGLLRGTGQLGPGELLEVVDGRLAGRRDWWTLPSYAPASSASDTIDVLHEVLGQSVSDQLVADRPVGTFLSGGVDSALVTALAVEASAAPVEAFTISFPGEANDEAGMAAAFASQLGVLHHVERITDDDAIGAVEDAVAASAEPVGDFSIIPTTVLSRFAAERVTVALSGDGGDELFFGYVRPWSLLRSGRWFRAPYRVRRGRYLAGRLPGVPAVSEAVAARSAGDYYRGVNSRTTTWRDRLAPGLPTPPDLSWYRTRSRSDRRELIELSRRAEFYGQLQRVLRKVDLASMHNSLEVRVPVLSRTVIELSATVDVDDALRAGQRKGPLRDLLARLTPTVEQQSAKQGFTPPLTRWIDGPLRPMIEEQLGAVSWELDGICDQAALRALTDPAMPFRHWRAWTVLSLEWWLQRLAAMPIDFRQAVS